MVKKILYSWVFCIAVLIAVLGAASFWFPYLGIPIAALTVLGAVLQGYENQRTQEDINTKHAQANSQIQMTQNAISTKHAEAMQEIAQARGEAVKQHAKALQEIDQARKEAARQYDEAAQEIKKARDEARAENILLNANKFATNLMEKDALVKEAVALFPDFRQRELRQLGIEMSIAVINGYDPVTQRSLMIAGLGRGMDGYNRLERNEIAKLTATAIIYLRENVLETTMPDADGLHHLACMYGYQQQFEDTILTIEQAVKIDEKIKEKFQQRKVLQMLLMTCDLDEIKLERLRRSLDIQLVSKKTFCKYLQDFDLTGFNGFIEWVAIKRPKASGEKGTFLIQIAPPYPSNEGKVSAAGQNIKTWKTEVVISNSEPVAIEELYEALYPLFILFCPTG